MICKKNIENPETRTSFTHVVDEVAKIQYNQTTIDSGTKITKNTKNDQTSSFWEFSKNLKCMPHIIFDEEAKTGLNIEIGQREQKCLRKPSLQSLCSQSSCNLLAVRYLPIPMGRYVHHTHSSDIVLRSMYFKPLLPKISPAFYD